MKKNNVHIEKKRNARIRTCVCVCVCACVIQDAKMHQLIFGSIAAIGL